MVWPASDRISRVLPYSGFYTPFLLFHLRGFHSLWPAFPKQFYYSSKQLIVVLNPKWISSLGLGSSGFARHYSRNRFLFLFLRLLRCFSSPRFTSHILFYSYVDNTLLTCIGFPHSDIHGSLDICSSPWLFAACHVFLRLLVPRHSPYALTSLT